MNLSIASLVAPVVSYILGAVLIAVALVLVILVAMQSGKEKGLSGSIGGGGSDTYFGKSKSGDKDARRAKITIVLSVVLVILVAVLTVVVLKTDFTAVTTAAA